MFSSGVVVRASVSCLCLWSTRTETNSSVWTKKLMVYHCCLLGHHPVKKDHRRSSTYHVLEYTWFISGLDVCLAQIGHSWLLMAVSPFFLEPPLARTGLALPRRDIVWRCYAWKLLWRIHPTSLDTFLKRLRLYTTLVAEICTCVCVLVKVGHSLAFCGCQSLLKTSQNLALDACMLLILYLCAVCKLLGQLLCFCGLYCLFCPLCHGCMLMYSLLRV